VLKKVEWMTVRWQRLRRQRMERRNQQLSKQKLTGPLKWQHESQGKMGMDGLLCLLTFEIFLMHPGGNCGTSLHFWFLRTIIMNQFKDDLQQISVQQNILRSVFCDTFHLPSNWQTVYYHHSVTMFWINKLEVSSVYLIIPDTDSDKRCKACQTKYNKNIKNIFIHDKKSLITLPSVICLALQCYDMIRWVTGSTSGL